MKKILLIILVLIVGCATNPHESLMKDMIIVFNEMVEIIEGVTDESSADAAIGKLEKLSKKMVDIKTKKDKLGDPDEEMKKALAEYESKGEEAMARLEEASMKIALKPYGEKVLKALEEAFSIF